MDSPTAHLTITFDKVRDLLERDLGPDCSIFLFVADSDHVATGNTFASTTALGNLLFEWLEKQGFITREQVKGRPPIKC